MGTTPAPPFTVKALYPYTSDHPDDLTFDEGQVIEVTAVEDDEWFDGSYSGKSGMFPRNFVEIIARPIPAAPARPIPKHTAKEPSSNVVESTVQDTSEAQTTELHQTKSGNTFEAQQTSHDKSIDEGLSQLNVNEDDQSASTKTRNAFKDRIAAFNTTTAPLVPKIVKQSSFIQKPYEPPAPSSYIPPSIPHVEHTTTSSSSNDMARSSNANDAVRSSSNANEPVRSSSPDQNQPEQEEAPKMSLKERIAMLQKEQERMHAEAEAALEKKKAKSRAKKEAKHGQMEATISGNSMSSTTTGDSIAQSFTGESTHDHLPTETEASEYGPLSETAEEREEEGDDEKEIDKEIEEEDEEDEEDEEEAKRIALRERMAKLSGGAGMNLGMIMTGGLGMPLPGSSTKKAARPKPKPVEEESDESYTPVQQAPMLPFTDSTAMAALQEKRRESNGSRPSPTAPSTASNQEEDDLSSEEEDENDDSSSAREPFRRISSKSEIPVTESGDADEEITTTQPEETSDDGFHSSSRPVSQSSVIPPPAKPVPPRLPSFDSHRPLGVVSDDELGDDEKTEPEESHHVSPTGLSTTTKRRSYIGGSGVAPPIPMSPTERKLSFEDRSMTMPIEPTNQEHSPKSIRRQSTFSPTSGTGKSSHPPPPPVPSAPPKPPHPPVVSREDLEDDTSDEDTGYEADIDMDKTSSAPNTRPPPPPRPLSIVTGNETHESASIISPTRPIPPSAPPAPPGHGSQDWKSPTAQTAPPVPPGHSSQDWKSPPAPPGHGTQDWKSPVSPLAPVSGRTSFDQTGGRPSLDQQIGRTSLDQTARTSQDHSAGRSSSTRKSMDKRRSVDRGGPGRSSIERGSSLSTARDISDLELESQWFLKSDGVPSIVTEAAVNGDLIYEIEDNETVKRGGRKMVTRDVYILHRDYSQTTISIRYEAHDPMSTVSSEQSHERPVEVTQDAAEGEWERFGKQIYELASRGQSNPSQFAPEEFVSGIISKIPDAVPSIGRRVHGVIVYDNLANATVKQLDEIRPGDVVSFKNAKLQGHKGSLHQKYSQEAGSNGTIHLGIVSEWDGTKQKMKVLEQSDNGRKIRNESYRIGDLKSGEIIVFRVVGREFVGWA